MFAATSLETQLLLLIASSPALTRRGILPHFESAAEAEKAIEGCLAKRFIEPAGGRGGFRLTEDGRRQI